MFLFQNIQTVVCSFMLELHSDLDAVLLRKNPAFAF